ncbi:DUF3082 domain-containing protein [filamentous cyanobacterium LEGE 11480]|uniref:DUF3082 domain-containing protein n=1 Tax=Romeriopsis navalis LEGE 11480 TaxID=2777977 RepID=A0A928VTH0_9CYAN|nr:DUF3082 domain-containing protein [Romeriopsis navalis]MBE9031779.1 DUF3082 domain-containing protein [Romeriopsis navalis LEGE 11480]
MADEKPKTPLAELKEIDDSAGKTVAAASTNQVTPLKCFLGAIVAGTIGFFLYRGAGGVALIFAKTQVHSDNFIVMRMSSAIRTLVIGIFAMGAGVFGMAAFGLTGLGIQTMMKKAPAQSSDS